MSILEVFLQEIDFKLDRGMWLHSAILPFYAFMS
jgi:hypothetical protein